MRTATELRKYRFGNALNQHKIKVIRSAVFMKVMSIHLHFHRLCLLKMIDYTLEEAQNLFQVICGKGAASVKQHRFQMLK